MSRLVFIYSSPVSTRARVTIEHHRYWQVLGDYIGSTNLLWPPATIAAYSNVGYQLLGDAMAAAAGESYSALLQSHLAAPLSMTDTTVRPSAEQCARLMIGTGQSGPGPCIDTSPSAASAGVYSTGDDMVAGGSGKRC